MKRKRMLKNLFHYPFKLETWAKLSQPSFRLCIIFGEIRWMLRNDVTLGKYTALIYTISRLTNSPPPHSGTKLPLRLFNQAMALKMKFKMDCFSFLIEKLWWKDIFWCIKFLFKFKFYHRYEHFYIQCKNTVLTI
jgi:hypothetical protein